MVSLALKFSTELDFRIALLKMPRVRFTRQEIQSASRLPLRTFNRCFIEYRNQGILRETGQRRSNGGRPATVYGLDKKKLLEIQSRDIYEGYASIVSHAARLHDLIVGPPWWNHKDFFEVVRFERDSKAEGKRRELWSSLKRVTELMSEAEPSGFLIIGPCIPGLKRPSVIRHEPPQG